MLLAIFKTATLEDLLFVSKKGSKNTSIIIKDIGYEYKITSRIIGFPFEWNQYRFDKPEMLLFE